MKIIIFFVAILFKLLPKFSDFIKSGDCIEKNHIKTYQTISSFYSKEDLTLIKKRLFLVKKRREIQVIITIIMLTRTHSLVPMRYTGDNIYSVIFKMF